MLGRMCSTVMRAGPLPAARQDELARPDRQCAGARDAGEHRNVEDADGDDGVDGARPEDRGDHDCRQKGRERKDEIVQPHQRVVDETAARRGQRAERNAEAHADADGDERDRNRIASADHDHRQYVPAEMVGAEPVRGRGRQRLVGYDQPGDVIGCPEIGEKRHRRYQHRHDEAGHERPVGECPGGKATAARCLLAHRHCRPRRRGSASA